MTMHNSSLKGLNVLLKKQSLDKHIMCKIDILGSNELKKRSHEADLNHRPKDH